jgi:alpha-mannosidase
MWFWRTIAVPKSLHRYELNGARLWFSVPANANGPMAEIFYFNRASRGFSG